MLSARSPRLPGQVARCGLPARGVGEHQRPAEAMSGEPAASPPPATDDESVRVRAARRSLGGGRAAGAKAQ